MESVAPPESVDLGMSANVGRYESVSQLAGPSSASASSLTRRDFRLPAVLRLPKSEMQRCIAHLPQVKVHAVVEGETLALHATWFPTIEFSVAVPGKNVARRLTLEELLSHDANACVFGLLRSREITPTSEAFEAFRRASMAPKQEHVTEEVQAEEEDEEGESQISMITGSVRSDDSSAVPGSRGTSLASGAAEDPAHVADAEAADDGAARDDDSLLGGASETKDGESIVFCGAPRSASASSASTAPASSAPASSVSSASSYTGTLMTVVEQPQYLEGFQPTADSPFLVRNLFSPVARMSAFPFGLLAHSYAHVSDKIEAVTEYQMTEMLGGVAAATLHTGSFDARNVLMLPVDTRTDKQRKADEAKLRLARSIEMHRAKFSRAAGKTDAPRVTDALATMRAVALAKWEQHQHKSKRHRRSGTVPEP